ncbi:MAG TPA: DUF1232 domain-containing protein [Candidatus Sericytochromatia bacterium]
MVRLMLNPRTATEFIPDFILFIGEIDDAVLVTLFATEVSQLLLDRIKSSKTQKSA